MACDGRLVADHERCWARHQTITDPGHLPRRGALRAPSGPAPPGRRPTAEVELRCLTDYDAAFGLDDGEVA